MGSIPIARSNREKPVIIGRNSLISRVFRRLCSPLPFGNKRALWQFSALDLSPNCHHPRSAGAEPRTLTGSWWPFRPRDAPAAQPRATVPATVRGTPPHFAAGGGSTPFGLRPLGAGGFPRTRRPATDPPAPRRQAAAPSAPRRRASAERPCPGRRASLPASTAPCLPGTANGTAARSATTFQTRPPSFQVLPPNPSLPAYGDPATEPAGLISSPVRTHIGGRPRKEGGGRLSSMLSSAPRRNGVRRSGRSGRRRIGSPPPIRQPRRTDIGRKRPGLGKRKRSAGCFPSPSMTVRRAGADTDRARPLRLSIGRGCRSSPRRRWPSCAVRAPLRPPRATGRQPRHKRPCACAWAAVFCQIQRCGLTLDP